MKWKHNQPFFWLLFASGGMLSAFITPAMVLLVGIAIPLGFLTGEVLSYEHALAFSKNWVAKAIILVVIALPLWHSAHRIFKTLHDVGIHGGTAVRLATYGLATLSTLAATVLLII